VDVNFEFETWMLSRKEVNLARCTQIFQNVLLRIFVSFDFPPRIPRIFGIFGLINADFLDTFQGHFHKITISPHFESSRISG